MKFCWRITKYDPIYRSIRGHYQKDEWTSMSDVGKIYGGEEFTIQDYLKIEDLYVNAVKGFMASLGTDSMKVANLERWNEELDCNKFREFYSQNMFALYESLNNGDVLFVNDLTNLCRLILRENIWCKLRVKWRMFVHFGYDYQMYIGTPRPCHEAVDNVIKSGLFVEPWKSPYESQR